MAHIIRNMTRTRSSSSKTESGKLGSQSNSIDTSDEVGSSLAFVPRNQRKRQAVSETTISRRQTVTSSKRHMSDEQAGDTFLTALERRIDESVTDQAKTSAKKIFSHQKNIGLPERERHRIKADNSCFDETRIQNNDNIFLKNSESHTQILYTSRRTAEKKFSNVSDADFSVVAEMSSIGGSHDKVWNVQKDYTEHNRNPSLKDAENTAEVSVNVHHRSAGKMSSTRFSTHKDRHQKTGERNSTKTSGHHYDSKRADNNERDKIRRHYVRDNPEVTHTSRKEEMKIQHSSRSKPLQRSTSPQRSHTDIGRHKPYNRSGRHDMQLKQLQTSKEKYSGHQYSAKNEDDVVSQSSKLCSTVADHHPYISSHPLSQSQSKDVLGSFLGTLGMTEDEFKKKCAPEHLDYPQVGNSSSKYRKIVNNDEFVYTQSIDDVRSEHELLQKSDSKSPAEKGVVTVPLVKKTEQNIARVKESENTTAIWEQYFRAKSQQLLENTTPADIKMLPPEKEKANFALESILKSVGFDPAISKIVSERVANLQQSVEDRNINIELGTQRSFIKSGLPEMDGSLQEFMQTKIASNSSKNIEGDSAEPSSTIGNLSLLSSGKSYSEGVNEQDKNSRKAYDSDSLKGIGDYTSDSEYRGSGLSFQSLSDRFSQERHRSISHSADGHASGRHQSKLLSLHRSSADMHSRSHSFDRSSSDSYHSGRISDDEYYSRSRSRKSASKRYRSRSCSEERYHNMRYHSPKQDYSSSAFDHHSPRRYRSRSRSRDRQYTLSYSSGRYHSRSRSRERFSLDRHRSRSLSSSRISLDNYYLGSSSDEQSSHSKSRSNRDSPNSFSGNKKQKRKSSQTSCYDAGRSSRVKQKLKRAYGDDSHSSERDSKFILDDSWDASTYKTAESENINKKKAKPLQSCSIQPLWSHESPYTEGPLRYEPLSTDPRYIVQNTFGFKPVYGTVPASLNTPLPSPHTCTLPMPSFHPQPVSDLPDTGSTLPTAPQNICQSSFQETPTSNALPALQHLQPDVYNTRTEIESTPTIVTSNLVEVPLEKAEVTESHSWKINTPKNKNKENAEKPLNAVFNKVDTGNSSEINNLTRKDELQAKKHSNPVNKVVILGRHILAQIKFQMENVKNVQMKKAFGLHNTEIHLFAGDKCPLTIDELLSDSMTDYFGCFPDIVIIMFGEADVSMPNFQVEKFHNLLISLTSRLKTEFRVTAVIMCEIVPFPCPDNIAADEFNSLVRATNAHLMTYDTEHLSGFNFWRHHFHPLGHTGGKGIAACAVHKFYCSIRRIICQFSPPLNRNQIQNDVEKSLNSCKARGDEQQLLPVFESEEIVSLKQKKNENFTCESSLEIQPCHSPINVLIIGNDLMQALNRALGSSKTFLQNFGFPDTNIFVLNKSDLPQTLKEFLSYPLDNLSRYTPQILLMMMGENDMDTSSYYPEIFFLDIQDVILRLANTFPNTIIAFSDIQPKFSPTAITLPQMINRSKVINEMIRKEIPEGNKLFFWNGQVSSDLTSDERIQELYSQVRNALYRARKMIIDAVPLHNVRRPRKEGTLKNVRRPRKEGTLKAVILGHSLARYLKNGIDPQNYTETHMSPNFDIPNLSVNILSDEVCPSTVRVLSNLPPDRYLYDSPEIVVIMLGENDVNSACTNLLVLLHDMQVLITRLAALQFVACIVLVEVLPLKALKTLNFTYQRDAINKVLLQLKDSKKVIYHELKVDKRNVANLRQLDNLTKLYRSVKEGLSIAVERCTAKNSLESSLPQSSNNLNAVIVGEYIADCLEENISKQVLDYNFGAEDLNVKIVSGSLWSDNIREVVLGVPISIVVILLGESEVDKEDFNEEIFIEETRLLTSELQKTLNLKYVILCEVLSFIKPYFITDTVFEQRKYYLQKRLQHEFLNDNCVIFLSCKSESDHYLSLNNHPGNVRRLYNSIAAALSYACQKIKEDRTNKYSKETCQITQDCENQPPMTGSKTLSQKMKLPSQTSSSDKTCEVRAEEQHELKSAGSPPITSHNSQVPQQIFKAVVVGGRLGHYLKKGWQRLDDMIDLDVEIFDDTNSFFSIQEFMTGDMYYILKNSPDIMLILLGDEDLDSQDFSPESFIAVIRELVFKLNKGHKVSVIVLCEILGKRHLSCVSQTVYKMRQKHVNEQLQKEFTSHDCVLFHNHIFTHKIPLLDDVRLDSGCIQKSVRIALSKAKDKIVQAHSEHGNIADKPGNSSPFKRDQQRPLIGEPAYLAPSSSTDYLVPQAIDREWCSNTCVTSSSLNRNNTYASGQVSDGRNQSYKHDMAFKEHKLPASDTHYTEGVGNVMEKLESHGDIKAFSHSTVNSKKKQGVILGIFLEELRELVLNGMHFNMTDADIRIECYNKCLESVSALLSDVNLADLLPGRPEVVVLQMGENDIDSKHFSVHETVSNFKCLTSRLQYKFGVKSAVVCSILQKTYPATIDRQCYVERMNEVNNALKAAFANNNSVLFWIHKRVSDYYCDSKNSVDIVTKLFRSIRGAMVQGFKQMQSCGTKSAVEANASIMSQGNSKYSLSEESSSSVKREQDHGSLTGLKFNVLIITHEYGHHLWEGMRSKGLSTMQKNFDLPYGNVEIVSRDKCPRSIRVLANMDITKLFQSSPSVVIVMLGETDLDNYKFDYKIFMQNIELVLSNLKSIPTVRKIAFCEILPKACRFMGAKQYEIRKNRINEYLKNRCDNDPMCMFSNLVGHSNMELFSSDLSSSLKHKHLYESLRTLVKKLLYIVEGFPEKRMNIKRRNVSGFIQSHESTVVSDASYSQVPNEKISELELANTRNQLSVHEDKPRRLVCLGRCLEPLKKFLSGDKHFTVDADISIECSHVGLASVRRLLSEKSLVTILPQKPDFIVLQMGENDIDSDNFTPAGVVSDFRNLIYRLQNECNVKYTFLCNILSKQFPTHIDKEEYERRKQNVNKILLTEFTENESVHYWVHQRIAKYYCDLPANPEEFVNRFFKCINAAALMCLKKTSSMQSIDEDATNMGSKPNASNKHGLYSHNELIYINDLQLDNSPFLECDDALSSSNEDRNCHFLIITHTDTGKFLKEIICNGAHPEESEKNFGISNVSFELVCEQRHPCSIDELANVDIRTLFHNSPLAVIIMHLVEEDIDSGSFQHIHFMGNIERITMNVKAIPSIENVVFCEVLPKHCEFVCQYVYEERMQTVNDALKNHCNTDPRCIFWHHVTHRKQSPCEDRRHHQSLRLTVYENLKTLIEKILSNKKTSRAQLSTLQENTSGCTPELCSNIYGKHVENESGSSSVAVQKVCSCLFLGMCIDQLEEQVRSGLDFNLPRDMRFEYKYDCPMSFNSLLKREFLTDILCNKPEIVVLQLGEEEIDSDNFSVATTLSNFRNLVWKLHNEHDVKYTVVCGILNKQYYTNVDKHEYEQRKQNVHDKLQEEFSDSETDLFWFHRRTSYCFADTKNSDGRVMKKLFTSLRGALMKVCKLMSD